MSHDMELALQLLASADYTSRKAKGFSSAGFCRSWQLSVSHVGLRLGLFQVGSYRYVEAVSKPYKYTLHSAPVVSFNLGV